MSSRLLTTIVPVMAVCAFALRDANADIYAWTDQSGNMTLSDVPPPKGVRVLEVVSEPPPGTAARSETYAPRNSAHDAHDVRILAERVRVLERQVDLASSEQAASAAQYQAAPSPQPTYGCQRVWADCWWWWTRAPYVYSPIWDAVTVSAAGFGHFHRFHGRSRGAAHHG